MRDGIARADNRAPVMTIRSTIDDAIDRSIVVLRDRAIDDVDVDVDNVRPYRYSSTPSD